MVHKGEVAPPQGAQLAPAAAGVDRQDVEGVVEDVLLGQGVEEVLGLLVCRDELFPPFRGRSIIRAGFLEIISLRLASLSTAETTVRYFCTVASWMGLPWWVLFRNSISRFSRAMGRSSPSLMAPM